jgi:hypothetical protein
MLAVGLVLIAIGVAIYFGVAFAAAYFAMRATSGNELNDSASVSSMMEAMSTWTQIATMGCWAGGTIGGIGLCMAFVGVIRWLWDDPKAS